MESYAKLNQGRTRQLKLSRRPKPIFRYYLKVLLSFILMLMIFVIFLVLWIDSISLMIVATITSWIGIIITPTIPVVYYTFMNRRSYKAWLSTFEDGWTPKEMLEASG